MISWLVVGTTYLELLTLSIVVDPVQFCAAQHDFYTVITGDMRLLRIVKKGLWWVLPNN